MIRVAILGNEVAENRNAKLVDARKTRVERRVGPIVQRLESAGGGFKLIRNAETQGILSLRGKILNTEKVDGMDRILNEKGVIKDIVIGLGTGMLKEFDLENLRYHKVIICVDKDFDGEHIRTLLFTFFFKYMRPLIEQGHLYISVPPLYKVRNGKTTIYLKDDKELEATKSTRTASSFVTRFKGLGEMEASDLFETIVNPATRRIKQITMKDAEEVMKSIDLLMGKNIEPRKKFIAENAQYANVI